MIGNIKGLTILSYLELDQMLGPWLLVLEVHRVCLTIGLVMSWGRGGVSHDPSGERIRVLLQHQHRVRKSRRMASI